MAAQAGRSGKGENIRVILFGKAVVAGGFLPASLNVLPFPVGEGYSKVLRRAAVKLHSAALCVARV